MRDAMMGRLTELRHEPTEKRLRAVLNNHTTVDTTRAVLVWEPRRVVPVYAVPEEDLRAELEPAPDGPGSDRAILHPGIPFATHSTPGASYTFQVGDQIRPSAAFRVDDADLAGYLLLDFHAFDKWYEEDEPIVGHPRDPYHRVDVRASSRQVRVELDGVLLAESTQPTLVFETSLPTRFYMPREDVREVLEPSPKVTYCAYKGEASYWSTNARENVAWTYREPLVDAAPLAGLVAFFDELVDVTVDGQRRSRPATPIARAVLDEAGIA